MDELNVDNKFIIIPEWILLSNISDKAKVLYGALWKYADRNSNKCFPSRKTLSKDLNCHPSSVDRCLKELVKINAIKIENRPPKENGANQSNLYTLITIPVSADKDTPISTSNDTPISDSTNTPVSLDNDLTITKVTKTNITKGSHKKVRKRDLIFEELCIQCGIDWKNSPRNELGRVQKATKQLKEIEATVDDIKKVATWYKTNWKDIDITPTAIVSNYSSILRKVEDIPKPHNCETDGHKFVDLDVIFHCRVCKLERNKV